MKKKFSREETCKTYNKSGRTLNITAIPRLLSLYCSTCAWSSAGYSPTPSSGTLPGHVQIERASLTGDPSVFSVLLSKKSIVSSRHRPQQAREASFLAVLVQEHMGLMELARCIRPCGVNSSLPHRPW